MNIKPSVVIAIDGDKVLNLHTGGDAAAAEAVWKDARGKYGEVLLIRKPVAFRRWKGKVVDAVKDSPVAKARRTVRAD